MSKRYILSMNINGPSDEGCREERENGIVAIVKEYSPLLVFVQECPWKNLLSTLLQDFSNLTFHKKLEKQETAETKKKETAETEKQETAETKKKETAETEKQETAKTEKQEHKKENKNVLYNGILCDTKAVTCSDLTDTSVTETYETLHGNWSEKFKLCRLALFKVNLLTCEILCASWHGPNTSAKGGIKKDHLKSMLAFLLELKKREKCPMIIGGDFNLRAKEVKNHLNRNFQLRTPSESSKDMILFTPDVEDIFNISDVEALPMNKDYTFDHAPLKIEDTTEEKDGERAEAGGGQEIERYVQNPQTGREDEKNRMERRKKEEEGKKDENDYLSSMMNDLKIDSKK